MHQDKESAATRERYETIAIPFVQFGNRRGLTAQQIYDNPWLGEFYSQFKHCFEVQHYQDIVLFIEPEDIDPGEAG